MLHSVKDLSRFTIEASDGTVGKPCEFCFDDRTWNLRYVVADIGDWLLGHKVLISIDLVDRPEPAKRQLPVALTLQEVQNSPDISADKPVYLQYQRDVYAYLGLGGETHMSGTWMISPLAAQVIDTAEQERARERQNCNPHLRSTREVIGYHVDATDGEIGHVADFIVDDQAWQINHVVIDTHNWRPGKKVMITPRWIVKVRWSEKKVYVALRRQAIELSPEFDPESLRRESTR